MQIEQLISNLGFPIAICLALGVFVVKFIDKTMTNMEKNQDEVKDMLLEEIKYNREVNSELLSTNKLLAKDITVRLENNEVITKEMSSKINEINVKLDRK